MQVGRSPEGKWVHVEDKVIVATFETREEAIAALAPKAPKVHKHAPKLFFHRYKDLGPVIKDRPDRDPSWQHIELGYWCDCGEEVVERVIGHALMGRFIDGEVRLFNQIGEPAENVPERYWS